MNFSLTKIVQFIRAALQENKRQLKIILKGQSQKLYRERLQIH